MNKLIFATNNQHKLEEVRAILGHRFEIVSLAEAGCFEDIPETADTIEGNALMKAQYVYDKYRIDCFADDTGLEINALNGEPGVYSARYAGEARSPVDNMNKVLTAMQGIEHREAAFRTVIALILSGRTYTFEGIIKGRIALKPSGEGGFGYDPVFVPDGYKQTFAELGSAEKNKISHRALAVGKLIDFLSKEIVNI